MSCRSNTVLRVLRISKNALSYILLSQSVALDGPIESLCAELLTFWFVDHHKKGFSPDPTPMGFRNWYYTCMGREYNNVKQLSQPIPVTRVVDWQCTNVKSSQKKERKMSRSLPTWWQRVPRTPQRTRWRRHSCNEKKYQTGPINLYRHSCKIKYQTGPINLYSALLHSSNDNIRVVRKLYPHYYLIHVLHQINE